MSIWTHVAGIIRIDDTRFGGSNVKKIKELIEEGLPYGSEDSLKFEVYEPAEKRSIAAYVVSIYGDLRDFDSSSEVIDWFKGVCYKIEEMKSDDIIFIRQATITSRTEGREPENWTFVSEYEKGTTPAANYSTRHYDFKKEVETKIIEVLGNEVKDFTDKNYEVLVQESKGGQQFPATLVSISANGFIVDDEGDENEYELMDMNLADLCIILDNLISGEW